jgi:hypothetical protein
MPSFNCFELCGTALKLPVCFSAQPAAHYQLLVHLYVAPQALPMAAASNQQEHQKQPSREVQAVAAASH